MSKKVFDEMEFMSEYLKSKNDDIKTLFFDELDKNVPIFLTEEQSFIFFDIAIVNNDILDYPEEIKKIRDKIISDKSHDEMYKHEITNWYFTWLVYDTNDHFYYNDDPYNDDTYMNWEENVNKFKNVFPVN